MRLAPPPSISTSDPAAPATRHRRRISTRPRPSRRQRHEHETRLSGPDDALPSSWPGAASQKQATRSPTSRPRSRADEIGAAQATAPACRAGPNLTAYLPTSGEQEEISDAYQLALHQWATDAGRRPTAPPVLEALRSDSSWTAYDVRVRPVGPLAEPTDFDANQIHCPQQPVGGVFAEVVRTGQTVFTWRASPGLHRRRSRRVHPHAPGDPLHRRSRAFTAERHPRTAGSVTQHGANGRHAHAGGGMGGRCIDEPVLSEQITLESEWTRRS